MFKNLLTKLFPAIFAKPLYRCNSCGFIQRDCKQHAKIDYCLCGKDDWDQNFGNNVFN